MIPNRLIIFVTDNPLEDERLDYWREQQDPFPSVYGFFRKIDADDHLDDNIALANGESICSIDIGTEVFCVTDGHHRSTVCAERGINVPIQERDIY